MMERSSGRGNSPAAFYIFTLSNPLTHLPHRLHRRAQHLLDHLESIFSGFQVRMAPSPSVTPGMLSKYRWASITSVRWMYNPVKFFWLAQATSTTPVREWHGHHLLLKVHSDLLNGRLIRKCQAARVVDIPESGKSNEL